MHVDAWFVCLPSSDGLIIALRYIIVGLCPKSYNLCLVSGIT